MCWLWPQHRLLHLKDCGILYTLLIRQIWALDLRTSSVAVIAMIWYDNLLNLKTILTHPPCQWWEYASYESKNHLRSELTPLLFLRDKQTTMPMTASHFCLGILKSLSYMCSIVSRWRRVLCGVGSMGMSLDMITVIVQLACFYEDMWTCTKLSESNPGLTGWGPVDL